MESALKYYILSGVISDNSLFFFLWPQRDAEKKEKKNEKKSTGVFFPLILRETQKEKKRNGLLKIPTQ